MASGYTLVPGEEAHDGAPVTDHIVTDGGVLVAAADHGATWRFCGLVAPEVPLLDLGFVEAWELTAADTPPRPSAGRRFLAA